MYTIKTIRSIYGCIFYFVDNNIADTGGIFGVLLLFQPSTSYWILSKAIYKNVCLLCYLVRTVEDSTEQFYQS